MVHRDARGGANNRFAIQGQHEETLWRAGVGIEVLALVVHITVVQVGKMAKHLDPQAREIIQVWFNLVTAEPAY